MNLFRIIDSVIDCLGSPERIGVVEFQQIHSLARVLVTPCVDVLVAVESTQLDHLADVRTDVLGLDVLPDVVLTCIQNKQQHYLNTI